MGDSAIITAARALPVEVVLQREDSCWIEDVHYIQD